MSRYSRRTTLACGLATLAAATLRPARAQSRRPLRIGLTCDQTGQFGKSGQDELRGITLAIEEQNAKGGVLGRPIEWVTADTRTTPDVAAQIAERFVKVEDCAFLIGAVHSGVAQAITGVAARTGTIYFNTNSSAASQSGADCARVKFVWDGNGANFARAAVSNAMKAAGRRWVLLTNDYVWGHTTASATRAFVEQLGGTILDNIVVPPETTEFAAILQKIRALQPDVVSTAIGGVDSGALRAQVVRAGMEGRPLWIGSQYDWPDVFGQPDALFGVFGTTWYHYLDLPGVPSFVSLWRRRFGESPMPVPGNVSYNGYMATRELFRAMERTQSTNNVTLIRALEELKVPATERMQHFDAWMDPATHQLQQTIYLARRNPNPRNATDLFELIAWSDPTQVADTDAPTKCSLTPYADIPVVDG